MSGTIMVKDLKRGDRVESGTTIIKVEKDHLIEVFGDVAYRVEYKGPDGEIGSVILGGKSRLELIG